MQIVVKSGLGQDQTIVVNGVAELTDRSGVIAEADTAQVLMAANPTRGGWAFQNLSEWPMIINEIGADASEDGGFQVQPLGFWPPPNYPVTVEAISVKGPTVDAKFTAREW